MSRVFQSAVFRAICAIIIGALLVKYREQTVTGITIAIGVIFFISGLVSIIAYYAAKGKQNKVEIFDAEGRPLVQSSPSFPIVGIGSVILGAMLALMPGTFISGLMYFLAAILILGGLNQFFSLASATRWAHIGIAWWIMPSVVLLVGVLAVAKPELIASAPLFVIGWCMIVYGTVDLVNAVKLHQCRKAYEELHSAPLNPVTVDPEAEPELVVPEDND